MNHLKNSKLAYLFVAYFLFIFVWWLKINLFNQEVSIENYLFNLSYGFIALLGGIYGIYISFKTWGGYKSIIGRGILFLALGLLGEWFGNIMWGFGNLVSQQPIPYPGPADIGFFSIIPFYGLAVLSFAHATGTKFNLKTLSNQLIALIVPIIMVSLAWYFFIKDIPLDFSNPIKVFLDFGYPGFEAIIVSLTIITYSLSRKLLGGAMRPKILFVLIALSAQYITDYTFLYRSAQGTYFNAGPVDMMYAISLTLMALCLITFKKLNPEN